MRVPCVAAALCSTVLVPTASAVVVTFDPLVVGTNYGQSFGHSAGDLLLTESGVNVRLQKFKQINDSETFILANVKSSLGTLTTKCVYSSNLALDFDFTSLGFAVNSVTVLILAQGGIENLGVNGSAPYVGGINGAPATLGGAAVSITPQTAQTPGKITITGAIQSFRLGGQEFALDTITATPAPGVPTAVLFAGVVALRRRRHAA